MGEEVAFEGCIVNRIVDDLKEYFGGIEVEDPQQHLRHVQFRFEKLVVSPVTVDVGVDGALVVLVYLVFVYFEEVESNIVRVRLNGIDEKVNLERHMVVL